MANDMLKENQMSEEATNLKDGAMTGAGAAGGAITGWGVGATQGGQAGMAAGGAMGAATGGITGWGVGVTQGVVIGLVTGMFLAASMSRHHGR